MRLIIQTKNIIITATTSSTPVLPNEKNLYKDKTIIAIGSYQQHTRELPDAVFGPDSSIFIELDYAKEETGDLFNLEATPAESTSYRLAKHDKEQFPNIITSGTTEPFYTNSSQLPVDYTADVLEALDHQESLQTKYTGGTMFHVYMGEALKDWKACADLVRTISHKYRIPFFTVSPTYSICKIHGYISGQQFECPKCKAEKEKELKAKLKALEEEKEKILSESKK